MRPSPEQMQREVMEYVAKLDDPEIGVEEKARIDYALTMVADYYDMTTEQLIAWMRRGPERHEGAANDECGEVSPYDLERWCRLAPGHDTDHDPRVRRES